MTENQKNEKILEQNNNNENFDMYNLPGKENIINNKNEKLNKETEKKNNEENLSEDKEKKEEIQKEKEVYAKSLEKYNILKKYLISTCIKIEESFTKIY